MKKKLIFAGAVVLMAAAAVTAYMANYRPDPFDLLNANIEALHRMNHWIQGNLALLNGLL